MDMIEAAALRAPFPPALIGKLPKAGVMLDFVGHAATTDRLLQVDPEWSWEPMGVDESGLPKLDDSQNLWIRLTVCGVTRIGCGDGPTMKERIGDAIRNASMRFGVALDLWSKEDLAVATAVSDPDILTAARTMLDNAETLDDLEPLGELLRAAIADHKISLPDRDELAAAWKTKIALLRGEVPGV